MNFFYFTIATYRYDNPFKTTYSTPLCLKKQSKTKKQTFMGRYMRGNSGKKIKSVLVRVGGAWAELGNYNR